MVFLIPSPFFSFFFLFSNWVRGNHPLVTPLALVSQVQTEFRVQLTIFCKFSIFIAWNQYKFFLRLWHCDFKALYRNTKALKFTLISFHHAMWEIMLKKSPHSKRALQYWLDTITMSLKSPYWLMLHHFWGFQGYQETVFSKWLDVLKINHNPKKDSAESRLHSHQNSSINIFLRKNNVIPFSSP